MFICLCRILNLSQTTDTVLEEISDIAGSDIPRPDAQSVYPMPASDIPRADAQPVYPLPASDIPRPVSQPVYPGSDFPRPDSQPVYPLPDSLTMEVERSHDPGTGQ